MIEENRTCEPNGTFRYQEDHGGTHERERNVYEGYGPPVEQAAHQQREKHAECRGQVVRCEEGTSQMRLTNLRDVGAGGHLQGATGQRVHNSRGHDHRQARGAVIGQPDETEEH